VDLPPTVGQLAEVALNIGAEGQVRSEHCCDALGLTVSGEEFSPSWGTHPWAGSRPRHQPAGGTEWPNCGCQRRRRHGIKRAAGRLDNLSGTALDGA